MYFLSAPLKIIIFLIMLLIYVIFIFSDAIWLILKKKNDYQLNIFYGSNWYHITITTNL